MGRVIETYLGIDIFRSVHWQMHMLGYEWVDADGNHFFCETLQRARNSILRNVYDVTNIPISEYN